jgi:predicted O-methyltransferase YrrM
MTEELWTRVDRYFEDALLTPDDLLAAVQQESAAAGLPQISVSPAQGKLLFVLAKAVGARRILELGTLAGYSGIWLARALPPDGRLVTVEVDSTHADVARRSFARTGVSHLIDLRVQPALEALPQLAAEAAEGAGPFDFIFIDADKVNYPQYLEWAIRLSRRGTLIIIDNVVRHGEVADGGSSDSSVLAVRRMTSSLENDKRVDATVLQTVGVKGYDGFAVVVVN